MDKITLNKKITMLSKFETFFNKIKDVNVLKELLNNEKIVIDYYELYNYDEDLADLLLEKPVDIFLAGEKAITKLFNNNVKIRVKNIPNKFLLEDITSELINKFIRTTGIIVDIRKPQPILDKGVFECKGCMKLIEVEQTYNNLSEPSLCTDCGGRSFKLLQEESYYKDAQILTIQGHNTSRKIRILLNDDLISYDLFSIGDLIKITGIPIIYTENNNLETIINVNYYELIKDSTKTNYEVEFSDIGDRNAPEYNNWRNNILNRDNGTCQVCGEKRHPHIHHIFSFKNNPNISLDSDNGIVLCRWCHLKYHDIFGKETANPVTLIKFLKGEY